MNGKRKKILISIDWFLPGTLSGGPVRSYANLVAHLKDNFEFYIVTRNTDFGSSEPYKNIEPNTWVAYNDYTKVYYISPEKLTKAHLNEVFKNTDFDVAYINGIYSFYFSILPVLLLKKFKKPILVSARGMLNPQAFSVKGTKKKIYLRIAHYLGFYNKVGFHATNKDEANCIKKEIGVKTVVSIAPNLPRALNEQKRLKTEKHSPVKFVNVARISIEKGTLKMLKSLKDLSITLQLDLFGPIYDKDYWKKCEDEISKLPRHIKVNYKGVLESNAVPKTLCQYDFFVLLSEGENFGHAILEALAVGLPVIISKKTPWRNLEAQCLGWDIDIDNRTIVTETFEKAVKLSNHDYLFWSKSSLDYAKKFINNPELVEQNKALFLSAIKKLK